LQEDATEAMNIMRSFLTQFWNDESAATAIEYGLIATLLSITILTAALSIGGGVSARFEQVSLFVAQ